MGVARGAGSYGSRFIVGDGRATEADLAPFIHERIAPGLERAPTIGLVRAFFNRRSPHCGRGQSTFMGVACGAGSYGSRFIVGDGRGD
jgi:hypothetical protein